MIWSSNKDEITMVATGKSVNFLFYFDNLKISNFMR